MSHVQLQWQFPEVRHWTERLAEKRIVVRYDGRGSGLSERDVTDYSLDALLRDLQAVVNHLGLERFALFAPFFSGLAAVAYAARYPERVSHVILWCSFARGSDFWRSPRTRAFTAIRDTDWDLYTEIMAISFLGRSPDEEESRVIASFIREAVTQEGQQAFMDAARDFDVADQLPQLRTPTLVLHRRGLLFLEVGVARELASRIPDARLALLDGTSGSPEQGGDPEAVLTAINEFLGESEEAETESEGLSADIVHTILFTDVEGSTALTDRLGDAKARDLLREHERIVREALKAHGGSEVKTMGDGFMTSFSSATRALECAIAIQIAFAERNETVDEAIRVRIGLNAGEPIAEDDPGGRGDLFGTAVNMAARIASKAEGGEILVADVVRQLVAGKEFLFNDRGDTELRGFEDPVRVYEVRWRES
jgi:class 3 adenylate cyclase